jgi:hypothetical protein
MGIIFHPMYKDLSESTLQLADAIERICFVLSSTWSLEEWKDRVPHNEFWDKRELVWNSATLQKCQTWAELNYPEHVVEIFNERIKLFNKLVLDAEELLWDQTGKIYETYAQADGSLRVAVFNEFSEMGSIPHTLLIPLPETLRHWARQMVMEAVTPVEKEADGPCDVNQWRYGGRLSKSKMKPKEWELASYLWKRRNKKVPKKDLQGVNGMFEGAQESSVSKQGSNISAWFSEEEMPILVRTEKHHLVMEIAGTLKTER